MANIKIYDLRPAGFELFSDSENYMMDLSDELRIQGGTLTNLGSSICYIVDPTGHFTQSSATVHTPYPKDSFGD